jgi:hypothetical protein
LCKIVHDEPFTVLENRPCAGALHHNKPEFTSRSRVLGKAHTLEKGLTAKIFWNQCDLHVSRRKTRKNTHKHGGWAFIWRSSEEGISRDHFEEIREKPLLRRALRLCVGCATMSGGPNVHRVRGSRSVPECPLPSWNHGYSDAGTAVDWIELRMG